MWMKLKSDQSTTLILSDDSGSLDNNRRYIDAISTVGIKSHFGKFIYNYLYRSITSD
jgi:hypothetical protein